MAEMVQAFSRHLSRAKKDSDTPLLMIDYKYEPSDKMSRKRIEQISAWLCQRADLDAVVCGNQTVCYETLIAIRELGLNIPEDLFILSLGDNQWLPLLTTSITAFQQPIEQIARFTLDQLKRRLTRNADRQAPVQEKVYASKLMIRSSSNSFKVTD